MGFDHDAPENSMTPLELLGEKRDDAARTMF
jgi:hypothetical protein